MQLIKEISRKDFDPLFTPNPHQIYTVRKAARAILLRGNTIAILNATKLKLHKIPGGGIEQGEDVKKALLRELVEETGCDASIEKELGITIEYRDELNLIQISYVYVAKVKDEPQKITFTTDEINEGFELEWIAIDKVLQVMENDNPDDYSDNKYMSMRDKEIVRFYLSTIPITSYSHD